VPVYPDVHTPLVPPNSFVMRSSEHPLPQPLCNLHSRDGFGSAHSKGFTVAKLCSQILYHHHLRNLIGSVHSKGLISSLESALTKNSPLIALQCAVPKKRGRGCNG